MDFSEEGGGGGVRSYSLNGLRLVENASPLFVAFAHKVQLSIARRHFDVRQWANSEGPSSVAYSPVARKTT